jgi:hypothetical protein
LALFSAGFRSVESRNSLHGFDDISSFFILLFWWLIVLHILALFWWTEYNFTQESHFTHSYFLYPNSRTFPERFLHFTPQISIIMFDSMLAALEEELRADFNTALAGLVATARTRLEGAVAEVAKERAKGLAEVAKQKTDLQREVQAMQTHAAQQEGRVELNIGGYRFETSVQTLRRVPHTFFDAYFSGRYAQDVCRDGSIFVDRDGEHFGHVLEYMRDGVVSVAAPGAHPSVSLLRALKREFGYYCIELVAEEPATPELSETAYVIGGGDDETGIYSSMERYDALSDRWSTQAAMGTARWDFGACSIAGDIYVTGGISGYFAAADTLSSVEKYSPSLDTWNAVAPMPIARQGHTSVAVGSDLFVLGGLDDVGRTNLMHKFDTIQESWSEVAAIPDARCVYTAASVGTGIYAFCEFNLDSGRQDAVLAYDTLNNQWGTPVFTPYVQDQKLSANVIDGLICVVLSGNTWQFDPALEALSFLARTTWPRSHGATFVLGGNLYAAGGDVYASGVERYDVSTDTWTEVANMLKPRRCLSAVTIEIAIPAIEQDLFDSLISLRLRGRDCES